MSNRKNTRKENLNKYVDMLHRQNVTSGKKPEANEVKVTKPFEEKETKMEQQTELESMTMEEALDNPGISAMSANVLKECYQLIRAKISDNLLEEWKAEITEECTEESMVALRSYLATLSKEETQELISDVVKELVNGQLFNTINDLVQETEEKLEESDVKVDLMEEAKKTIEKKAAELDKKASDKIKEATKTESTEKVEKVVEEVKEKVAEEAKKAESKQSSEDTTTGKEKEESPKPNGFNWPMDKYSEMFPG
jgi:hypothetical protein